MDTNESVESRAAVSFFFVNDAYSYSSVTRKRVAEDAVESLVAAEKLFFFVQSQHGLQLGACTMCILSGAQIQWNRFVPHWRMARMASFSGPIEEVCAAAEKAKATFFEKSVPTDVRRFFLFETTDGRLKRSLRS